MELWLAAAAIGAAVALVAVTYVKRPEQRTIARRGIAYALIAALIIGGIVAAYVTTLVNGTEGILGTIRLGQALTLGVIAGAALGFAYASLNTLILVIGLWFRPSEGWAVGAALATPVILAAVGFGIVSYNSFQVQSSQPRLEAGTFAIMIAGQRLGHVTANGAASCTLFVNGGLSLDADVIGSDGGEVNVQLSVAADGGVVVAVVAGGTQAFPGKGWLPSADTTRLVDGWTRAAGQMEFSDLVPLGPDGEPDPTERWSGTLSWICPGA